MDGRIPTFCSLNLCKAGGSGRAARAMALPHFGLSDHVTLNE